MRVVNGDSSLYKLLWIMRFEAGYSMWSIQSDNNNNNLLRIFYSNLILLRHDEKIYLKKWCFSLSWINFWHSGHKTLSTSGDGDNNNCAVFLWLIILCVYVGGFVCLDFDLDSCHLGYTKIRNLFNKKSSRMSVLT